MWPRPGTGSERQVPGHSQSQPCSEAGALLVPGYVGREEVARIAAFISSLDSDIPYALLAFHPDFLMTDLPATFKQQAMECLDVARAAGLSREVR